MARMCLSVVAALLGKESTDALQKFLLHGVRHKRCRQMQQTERKKTCETYESIMKPCIKEEERNTQQMHATALTSAFRGDLRHEVFDGDFLHATLLHYLCGSERVRGTQQTRFLLSARAWFYTHRNVLVGPGGETTMYMYTRTQACLGDTRRATHSCTPP